MLNAKIIETIGTGCGIIGAVLVASKHGNFGYPFFLISSVSLLASALGQRQKNLVALQGVYFATNIIGLINYI